jgi:hypothetical protein
MQKLEKTLKSCDAIDKHAGDQLLVIGIRETPNFDSVWQIADTLKGDGKSCGGHCS